MKRKLIGISFAISTLAITTAVILTHTNQLDMVRGGDDHTANCHWNHYNRVEPTYNTRGIQEYYVCCEHHESILETPTIGHITEMGSPSSSFIASLENNDFRVIPSYQEQLEPVQSLIDKIPVLYSGTDGSLIDKAYREYNALSEAMKTYVQNVSKLTTAYESYHQNYGILIDTVLNEYTYKIYNATYDLECGYDETYGYYSSFNNILLPDDCWFGLGKNSNTNVYDYNEIYFYVYNESIESRDIEIRDKYDFVLYGKTHLASRAWTRVVIPSDVFVTYKLDDLFIGSYLAGKTNVLIEDGFKFTSLYGSLGKVVQSSYIDLKNDTAFNDNVTLNGEGQIISGPNKCIKITPDSYSASQGSVNLITKQAYSNITRVEFDAMIDGTGTGWWGIGHSSSVATARIYTGMATTGITTTGNEFQHVNLSLNVTGPEYIYFIVEVNTFHPFIYIDNVSITCGGVTYSDDFNDGSTLFNDNVSVMGGGAAFYTLKDTTYYMNKTDTDYCISINAGSYGGSEAGYKSRFISKQTYTNVTNITFDAKIVGSFSDTSLNPGENLWWGFGVGGDDDVYCADHTTFVLTTNNEWTTLSFNYTESGYVKFVINPNKTSGEVLIDNIVITTSGGTYTEGFTSNGSSLFEIGDFVSLDKRTNPSITFGGGTYDDVGNYSIKVDATNYGNQTVNSVGNAATVRSEVKYTNVTSVSFDLLIDGEITSDNPSDYWIGISHSSNETPSIYNGIQTRNLTTTNNTWRHFDFSMNITSGEYICFASNPTKKGTNNIYVDNFVIVANGVTYTDGFDNGASELFNIGVCASIYGHAEEFENQNLHDLLMNSGAYFEGPAFHKEGLAGNESLVFGTVSHEIIGNGRYAILIYNDDVNVDYLLINSNSIRLYHNTTIISDTNLNSNTYHLTVATNGAVSVNHNYLGDAANTNNALRFISLFNEGKVIFNDISLSTSIYTNNNTETIDGIVVPNFERGDNVVFAAYGSPTVENWDGTTNINMMTDEYWSDFVNAGFSKCIPLFEGRTGARYQFNTVYDQYLEETDPTAKQALLNQMGTLIDTMCEKANHDAMEALALAEKYNVQYVVLNTIIFELIHHTTPNGNYIHQEDYPFIFDRVFRNNYEYFYQVAYVGNFLQDEPLMDDNNEPLKRLLAALQLYYQACNNLGIMSEPIVNLLPGGYTSEYAAYLDYYFAHIAPLVGYVSFDQYVLDYDGSSYSIRTEHLANLEMMAQRILASSKRIQLRTYIFPHAVAEGSHRAITLADELRFQIYTNLAFGASEIIYYGYTTHASQDADRTITHGLVNMYTGEKSQVYYFAQEVNNEVLTFGSAYRAFTWEGVIAKQKTGIFGTGGCTQMKQLQYALSSDDGISSISYSQHTLIGCFTNPNGQDAYVVMHYNDPKTNSNTDNVTLTFNGYNGIIVYQNGEKHAYRLTNHQYSLSLKAGCGAFIIPITLD